MRITTPLFYAILPAMNINTDAFSTWVEIDLQAIGSNIRKIQELTGRPMMAVVKANGYGHGLVEVGQAAQKAYASWLGVARFEEALALRQGGVNLPILVLGYTPSGCVAQAVAHRISLAVYETGLGREYAERAVLTGGCLNIHVKVDSGMGRLGFEPDAVPEFIRWAANQPALVVEAIFTHYARSDEPEVDATIQQFGRFSPLIDQLKQVGICPALVHTANSAAAFYFPQTYFNLVRSGIAIYGLHPSPEAPLPPGFSPAAAWKACLTSVKMLPPGHGVSYGTSYYTSHHERIGVIPVGYADGFRRQKPHQVLIHGKRVPVVGRVCMDQCMLQLDSVPEAQVGDEVVLLGKQGNEIITAEEIAERWGTNNYEVVCGLAARLPRVYLSDKRGE